MSCRENVSEDLDKRPVGLKGLIELEDVLGSKVMRERAGKQLDKSGSLVPDKKDSERGGRLCRELDERCEGLELRLDEGERCHGRGVSLWSARQAWSPRQCISELRVGQCSPWDFGRFTI